MRNADVVRRFLAGKEGDGSNLYSRRVGPSLALISYDQPIAALQGGKVTWSDHDYSMTTNRHVRLLRQALNGRYPFHNLGTLLPHHVVTREILREFLSLPQDDPRAKRVGRHMTYDGYRVRLGEGGPSPEAVTV